MEASVIGTSCLAVRVLLPAPHVANPKSFLFPLANHNLFFSSGQYIVETEKIKMASLFNLAAVKNTLDEVRAQVYPRNETERKVKLFDGPRTLVYSLIPLFSS